jgi:hypothetical protein
VDHRAGLDGCGKPRPPTGVDLRTAHPVASRHADLRLPTHALILTGIRLSSSLNQHNVANEEMPKYDRTHQHYAHGCDT